MSPTPSSTRSSRAPPATFYRLSAVPLSGETAESITSHGARKAPRCAIEVGNVVRSSVYMDSIFFAADVQCRLANPANLKDERTLSEMKMLERQGSGLEKGSDLSKFRPCVVVGVAREAGMITHYLLCPMAGFHRQPYEALKEPASLLVRPVQTIDNNETFGDYTAYQFNPEWGSGPQYLFPIKVSRELDFVANHGLPEQIMDSASFERLLEDIEEVSNVWKKWRDAEHVVVEVDDDIPVFKSEWDMKDWGDLSPAQWKAYPSRENRRSDGRDGYLKLTNNIKFTKDTDDDIPFKESIDDSTLSNASEEAQAPLPAPDTLFVQDDHTPLRTPPPPYQVDFPTSGPSRATCSSKEVLDNHPAVPSHLVPAPPPRVTSLTKRDVILTKITSQYPHGEPSRLSDGSIQGHKASGAIGDAPIELEGPSDMDTSSTSSASASRPKYLAERHSFQSPERSNGPSVVGRDPVTPKVEDKLSHPSQHLLKDSEMSLRHDPNFLPVSDRIPVDTRTLSEVSKVEVAMLSEDPSIASWKKATISRGGKRKRYSEDELSAADLRPKRQRTTRN